MQPKTRLDPVVRLREREEQQARLRLAEAIRKTADAKQRLLDARLRYAEGLRTTALAAIWVVADDARGRALREVQRCEGDVTRAAAEEERVRAEFVAAHRAAEAVRRVRDARREEYRAEVARRERIEFDELAGLGFFHQR